MSNNVHVVILAGGQGSRFWPIGRREKPKQFLRLGEGQDTLIQMAVKRVIPAIAPVENLWVVASNANEKLISEQLNKSSIGGDNFNTLLEPVGKNTAASIAYAAAEIYQKNPNAIMVVLPSDSVIKNIEEFQEALRKGVEVASTGQVLVTLGIEPTSPHTGYGYIKRGKAVSKGVYDVDRFYEKPNLDRATEYLESGEYYWNTCMFVWGVKSILSSINEYIPSLGNFAEELIKTQDSQKKAAYVNSNFEKLENISIDIGVLEHSRYTKVIATKDLKWDDIGSWDSWSECFKKDANQNHLQGDVISIDSRNCVAVSSTNKLVALVGVDNLIVIDSGDSILVCPKDKAQDIRKVVEELKKLKKEDKY